MKKILMKQVKIIMDMDVAIGMIMDVAKTIEEEVVSIHQTKKERGETHIPQENMEEGTNQGKMKGECMINPKFNVIIVTNRVIMLINVEVPLIIWKDMLAILKKKRKKRSRITFHIVGI